MGCSVLDFVFAILITLYYVLFNDYFFYFASFISSFTIIIVVVVVDIVICMHGAGAGYVITSLRNEFIIMIFIIIAKAIVYIYIYMKCVSKKQLILISNTKQLTHTCSLDAGP